MKLTNLFWVFVLVCLILGGTGCGDYSDADSIESSRVEDQQKIYVENQPAPFFEYSLERDLLSQIYMAKNDAISTWSVISTRGTGEVKLVIPSIGYPIPADTQLTNPVQLQRHNNSTSYGYGVIEQAEPNGLFTSKNTNATFILAINSDGTVSPIYVEQAVDCYPFPVKKVGTGLEIVKGVQPSLKLKINTSTSPATTKIPVAEEQ